MPLASTGENKKSKKLSIAFVIGAFNDGGIAGATVRIAGVLGSRYQIDILVLGGDIRDKRIMVAEGINIMYMHDSRLRGRLGTLWRRIHAIGRLVRNLRSRKYHAVIGMGEIPASIPSMVAKLLGYRMISSARTDWERERRHRRDRGFFQYASFIIASRICYTLSDTVVAVTGEVEKSLSDVLNLQSARVRVIYNPIDRGSILSLAQDRIPSTWIGVYNSVHPVIVAMGRLTYQKGFDVLIDAISFLRKRGKMYQVLILGEGGLRGSLSDQISNLGLERNIQLVGYQRNPYPFVANADLFVMPSRWEGTANALVEALMCGTRVVATACPGGPREILTYRDETIGTLIKPDSSEALAEGIEHELLLANDARGALWQRTVTHRLKAFKPRGIERQWRKLIEY